MDIIFKTPTMFPNLTSKAKVMKINCVHEHSSSLLLTMANSSCFKTKPALF